MTDAGRWTLRIPERLSTALWSHLFRGDGDEHGAVLLCGMAARNREVRLLARELVLARDGIEYVAGTRGYRKLRGDFVTPHILRARDERLVYLAIHNHGGRDSVGFSGDDWASQQRGYPALLDVTGGIPVGALVIAENAVAGNIWLAADRVISLESTTLVGRSIRRLTAAPSSTSGAAAHMFDRQVRLFGDAGQALLAATTVAIVGVGGVGSLLVEYLARLGVGRIIVIDPDRVDLTNIPRLPHATRFDARSFFTVEGRPEWLRKIGRATALRKIDLARRIARRANREVRVEGVAENVADANVAEQLLDCDYIFLAADSMQARLIVNAICAQYLIPGVQIGAKVVADRATGSIQNVYSVVRPLTPGTTCLMCGGLISPAKLQDEALSEEERHRQRYVDDPSVIAPSVITLNAVGAAHAANDFLMTITGLMESAADGGFQRFEARKRDVIFEEVPRRTDCSECSESDHSRFARGDARRLPVRTRRGVKQA